MTPFDHALAQLRADIKWREENLSNFVKSMASAPESILTMADNLIRQKAALELLEGMQ